MCRTIARPFTHSLAHGIVQIILGLCTQKPVNHVAYRLLYCVHSTKIRLRHLSAPPPLPHHANVTNKTRHSYLDIDLLRTVPVAALAVFDEWGGHIFIGTGGGHFPMHCKMSLTGETIKVNSVFHPSGVGKSSTGLCG